MLDEESIPLTLDINPTDVMDATPADLRFAAGVSAYGMVLRDSKYKGTWTIVRLFLLL